MNEIKDEFLNKLYNSSYENALKLLKKKYGKPSGNYFVNFVNFTPNSKIKRTAEGLYLHHDLENQFIMLSHREYAEHCLEAQYAENLTYCNLLEHLILHILIHKERMTLYESLDAEDFYKAVTPQERTVYNENGESSIELFLPGVGIGGAVNYIIPDLDAWYGIAPHPKFGNIGVPTGWRRNCYEVIKDYKEDYLAIKELSKNDLERPVR